MASISAAQKLYEEAEDHTLAAMKLAHQLEGSDGITAASCYHMLSICYYYTNRQVWGSVEGGVGDEILSCLRCTN